MIKECEYVVPLVTLTDQDLAWIAENLTEVESLYMHFDLTAPEWTVINKNNPGDYASVKRQMLLCWRKKKGAEATLPKLVSVLATPENVDVSMIEKIINHFNVKCKFIVIICIGVVCSIMDEGIVGYFHKGQ